MFKWENKNSNFYFYLVQETEEEIPTAQWSNYQDDFLSQITILKELVENGLATYSQFTCEVETDEVLKLSDVDRQILGLPNSYPYEIYIQSDGQLNEQSFKFKYGFYDFTPNGSRFNARRSGAALEIGDETYLLSERQYLICEELDRFNSLCTEERTFRGNLKCFSDIKTLSKEAAVVLDSYLQAENVFCPDKIKIDLNFKDGVLEILPEISSDSSFNFINVFDRFSNIKEVYPVDDSTGNKTRVVIDEEKKKELEKIKKKRRISDEKEIAEIVEHPESCFDEEVIDLSVFYSDRVKEIGVYKPKFYSFVCPYKSEWIPGIAIKDRISGEKRIHFKNVEAVNEFEYEKTKAQKENKKCFQWAGEEISLEDGERFIRVARKQFEDTKGPLDKERLPQEDEVLIIKENAEVLEYYANLDRPEHIIHRFNKILNLSDFIKLKEHQEEGIAWLQSLYKENLQGCLLADDMGLGKTLQLLYFIEWHSQISGNSKPYLIVAPVALLENWENEYKRYFSPQNLPLVPIYSTSSIGKEFNKEEIARLQKKQIILTNYETLRICQFNLCAVDYAIVVLDEAQKIKTPGTLVTNVSKALKAEFKVAMTGTPVENTLVDLWCIMDFAVPGLLGNAKEFSKEYQNSLRIKEPEVEELGERLRRKIGVFIKRRLKKDVAKDLPTKHDNEHSRIKVKMPIIQLERYKAEIEIAKNSDLTGLNRRNQILKSLWAIRDISDHPYLADSQISRFTAQEMISSSAKLQILAELLNGIQKKNEKVIIFADRKETQKMLQKVIYEEFRLLPSIINGDTPTAKKMEGKAKLSRQQTIDQFQNENGFSAIIMSQLAAGVGLNVTAANHVIHFTRHWNPAKEEQATDRVYRIGQQKDVHVYYPMAVADEFESFDLILDKLLERKKSLALSTLFPTEQTEINPEEIFGDVFNYTVGSNKTVLIWESVDKLQPNLFEAFIAVLFSKLGYSTILTPYSNDKGVDVVALKDGENYLIQAKQSRGMVGNDAVKEIHTGKNYYENKFCEKFDTMVVTNNDFTNSANALANANNVKMVNRLHLEKMIAENTITISEISAKESQRMKSV